MRGGIDIREVSHDALRNSRRAPSAFGHFYVAHAEAVLVYFTRRVYDPQLALDLTAETFAEAFRCRKRFRGRSEEQAVAWLYAIAKRQLSRLVRRGYAERRVLAKLGIAVPQLDPEEYERVEDLAGLSRLRREIAEQFGKLSEDQQDALRLRVVEELSYSEVAERLAISEEAARARVSRGLRALATLRDAWPATAKEASQ